MLTTKKNGPELLLLLPAVLYLSSVQSLDLVRCGIPLGMESGDIPDSAITASSAYDSGSVGPLHGRLKHDKNGGAWCPRGMISKDSTEFLQVDLGQLTVITGTRTQGRFGNGQGVEFAEEFLLDYWRPGLARWRHWRHPSGNQKLPGNSNTYTVVEQKVDPIVIATKVRFVPHASHIRTVCMRVDVLGCPWQEGLLGYSMPQGDRLKGSEGMDLRDLSYDGVEEGNWLSGGLGQLIDGHWGHDDFTADVFGYGKGYEWVGWKNDSMGGTGRPVEMVFEFNSLRNFSAMHLHTNNCFSKGVQVFSTAKVFLSLGGKLFSGPPIQFQYMEDLIMEHARNVTIKLHQTVGRFLKLQLYFASSWIMVSEVSFDSTPVSSNVSEENFDINNHLGSISTSKEAPLQRDAVHSVLTKTEINKAGGARSVVASGGLAKTPSKEPSDTRHLIGLLIGALTTVILLLLAAIFFIVFRTRRNKRPGNHHHSSTDHFASEKNMELMTKKGHVYSHVGADETEKAMLYHEPLAHNNMYGFHQPGQPMSRAMDYTDIVQDYAVPLVTNKSGLPPPTPVRTLPPLHNFFPKPPPVPPPPDKYYAATEIIQKPPPLPSSPPGSAPPSTVGSNSSYVPPSSFRMTSPDEDDEIEENNDGIALKDIPRNDLKYSTKLGDGQFGEVHLFEILKKPSWARSTASKYVAVKVLRKDTSPALRDEFQREMEETSWLNHQNVACVVGCCLEKEPHLLVLEYTEWGDLYQFLQNHVAETASLPPSSSANTLSYGSLIYMATQIASGMKYLDDNKYILNDLATRNCIVGKGFEVKIADLGIARSLYNADYFELPGRGLCPIRWMAWESVLFDKYSSKSSVWTFAVTLWEILTFAREQPFEELTDEKVLENARLYEKNAKQAVILAQPINCYKEMYDLMCECWKRRETDRPTFKEIHMFLQRKNLGYKMNGVSGSRTS